MSPVTAVTLVTNQPGRTVRYDQDTTPNHAPAARCHGVATTDAEAEDGSAGLLIARMACADRCHNPTARRGGRTDVTDPRRQAAETLRDAILDARRIAGDGAVCDALDQLGASAGQSRYRRAAAAIRGLAPGRSAIDDDRSLRRISAFPPAQRRDAVSVVARDVAGIEASSKQVHAIASRLRGKLAKMKRMK
jgi:hypothetical protein